MLVLAVNSGATDAIGFVGLGGVFTSVMTGNMVLLGVSISQWDGTLALHTLLVIACFALGCGIGARIAHLAEDPAAAAGRHSRARGSKPGVLGVLAGRPATGQPGGAHAKAAAAGRVGLSGRY